QYIGDPDKDYANRFSILKSVMTEMKNLQAQLAAANKELEALRAAPLVAAVQTPIPAAAAHLPPLTSLDMKDWFRQAEAQFAYKGITSERTKFYYVTSCWDSSIKRNLREEDKDPVDPEAYQTIKRVILTRCRPPAYARVQRFIESLETGFLDPITADAEFRVAFEDDKPEEALDNLRRFSIIQHAPPSAKALLQGSFSVPFDSFMDLATSLSLNPQVSINASSKSPKPDKKHLCFYHHRFGAKAQKCLTPDICKPLMASKNAIATGLQ
ncbi:Uncharacterized protein FKW44_023258, partial [Caligus rogercresseyi]